MSVGGIVKVDLSKLVKSAMPAGVRVQNCGMKFGGL